MTALGRLLRERAEDDRPALLYDGASWSYRELVEEGWRRAARFAEVRDPDRPPHVGVLLDNVPDFLFWLTAGALSGTVTVGIVRRDPTMPPGALGTADESVKVLDPDTGRECPPAGFDDRGRVVNLDEAVGEIVETRPSSGFEGYYRNEAATAERFREGAYWSGDLAYRDADGWLYFAGRSNEWLRVDGENFAAGPVVAILARHPDVRSVAVHAVPDDPVGDRVMAALEQRSGTTFDPVAFDAFLGDQPDLGPKWVPSFVRVDDELPKLSSMKLDKKVLRRDAWQAERVAWRPSRGEGLRPLTAGDRRSLARLLATPVGRTTTGEPAVQ